jgi:hypothetical protein
MNYAALAGNLCGDGSDQHCVASQAVWRLETLPSAKPKRPANGGLLRIAGVSLDSDLGSFTAPFTKGSF